MANLLMIPAIASGTLTTKVNGRTFTSAAGSAITVADFDGLELSANGWIVSGNATGTTAQRPTLPPINFTFNDTTVGAMVIHVGKGVWVHHQTGVVS